MKVRATIGNKNTSEYKDYIAEFDDNATDNEIVDYFWEIAIQNIDLAWERIEEEDEKND